MTTKVTGQLRIISLHQKSWPATLLLNVKIHVKSISSHPDPSTHGLKRSAMKPFNEGILEYFPKAA
jgi:hypothetical protein